MAYGDHTNLKSSELNDCPGCDGKKYFKSVLCKSCWAAANTKNNHSNWKGGPKDICPGCGGIKCRQSITCRSCRRSRFEDGKHINAAEYARAFRKTPKGKRYVRAMNLKKYGLTPEAYDSLVELQNGVCASCGNPEVAKNQFGSIPLAVDHDHETNVVRGLLCMRCNRSLGMLSDSVETIEALASYRRKFL